MSQWRRKATRLFPELCQAGPRGSHIWKENGYRSIYHLFFDLLPLAMNAHAAGDDTALKKVYGYAEWCFRSPIDDINNAVAVCFFEHLVDPEPRFWREFLPWVSEDVRIGVEGLWEWRLEQQAGGFKLLQQMQREIPPHRARHTVYGDGSIRKL